MAPVGIIVYVTVTWFETNPFPSSRNLVIIIIEGDGVVCTMNKCYYARAMDDPWDDPTDVLLYLLATSLLITTIMPIQTVPLTLPPSADPSKFTHFGREVIGVDPGNLSPSEFSEIEQLLYKVRLGTWSTLWNIP